MYGFIQWGNFALELFKKRLIFNLKPVDRCTLLYFFFKHIKYSTIRGTNTD